MARSLTIRSAGAAAVLSGASLIAAGATLLLVRDPDHWDCNSGSDLGVNALYLAAFVLLAPAIIGLHRAQSALAPRWASLAASVAAYGAVVTGMVNAAEHCLHLPIGVLFATGALVTVVALVVFAVSLVRTRLFPPWIGVALVVGTLILQLAGDRGGIFAFAAAWVAVGVWLLVRPVPMPAPPADGR